MNDDAITPFLIEDYEAVAGPIQFTLSRIGPDREAEVARLMREVIDGKRKPLTDADLDQEIPARADS